MDKESLYLLQKLDCNCNDCAFLARNMDKFNESVEFHRKLQLDYYNTLKQKLIERANYHKRRYYDLEKWDKLLTEADNMKFQFNRSEAMISFGYCNKLNKDISFISNTCQIDTQQCFLHRKDLEVN